MRITPNQPYAFDVFYQIHARYPQPSLFHLHDGAYYRAVDTSDGLGLAEVRADGDDLLVTSLVGDVPLSEVVHIMAPARDVTGFYEFARQNAALWSIVEPLQGLPLYRAGSLYEALIFVIIEQHISWVSAQRAQWALVQWADNHLSYRGHAYYAMPTPYQLADATIDDLRPLKITFKRMQLLIDLSRRFVDEPDFLQDATSANTLYDSLLAIKGVGHWTASVVVARALGMYRYVPHNDVALQAAVARYYNTEKSGDATKAIFTAYADFAGLAAHFTLMKWVLDDYPVMIG